MIRPILASLWPSSWASRRNAVPMRRKPRGTALLTGAEIFAKNCSYCHAPGDEHAGTRQLRDTRGEEFAVLQQRTDLQSGLRRDHRPPRPQRHAALQADRHHRRRARPAGEISGQGERLRSRRIASSKGLAFRSCPIFLWIDGLCGRIATGIERFAFAFDVLELGRICGRKLRFCGSLGPDWDVSATLNVYHGVFNTSIDFQLSSNPPSLLS